jgi:hypothetical protein
MPSLKNCVQATPVGGLQSNPAPGSGAPDPGRSACSISCGITSFDSLRRSA